MRYSDFIIATESVDIRMDYPTIAKSIKEKCDNDSRPPVGNQNCMLCTWCSEMQCRGEYILPRPVYSPRDVIFTLKKPYGIIKNPKPIHCNSLDRLKETVLNAGSPARFYTHVNWKESNGGHEFLVINEDEMIFILDSQNGIFVNIESPEGRKYFDINWKNSYLVRLDQSEIDRNILRYNDMRYLTPWNDELDISYLKKEGLL